MTNEGATFIFTYEIQFSIVQFSLVNDTEALVFGYMIFTGFVRPLVGDPKLGFRVTKTHPEKKVGFSSFPSPSQFAVPLICSTLE